MKAFILILTICASMLSSAVVHAQLGEAATRSMFSDFKSARKGDVVTILIVEDVQADNGAKTQTNATTNLSVGVNGSVNSSQATVSGGIGSGNSFSGNGQTSRNENVKAKLTARIVEADNLSALKIEGRRTVTINGETQVIVITGTVRYVDISPDNTVFSYNIADLTLSYNGEGTITKAQEPGLFTKFLRFLF